MRWTTHEHREQRERHQQRLAGYVADRVERMKRGQKHPIHDFLFEYYAFRPTHLLRWSPGAGVTLDGLCADDSDWPAEMTDGDGGCRLKPIPPHRHAYIRWACEYLKCVQERPPQHACFGMHEWAMVYEATNVRHSQVPLRLSGAMIKATVDEVGLRCTHFDAYRFFTPAAVPLNRWPLTRPATLEHDQPGCIHVAMDLYKFAFKMTPWIASDVLADAFELAWQARYVDMRASPYDFASLGVSPIAMETRAGRDEYVSLQREISLRAQPVREQLLQAYRRLAQEITISES
jgi:hypothetical protein